MYGSEEAFAQIRQSWPRLVFEKCTKSLIIDQSEGILDPGIPERPFAKFAHRRSLASSRFTFLLFFRVLFSALRPELNAWKKLSNYNTLSTFKLKV